MTLYRGPYYSATSCKDAARPGTSALVSWFLGAYASRGARNLGTYACKRLGSGWSIHAERRAADLGTIPYGGVDSEWGWAFANALRLNSAELGVQLIILGRKVWSCKQPDAGWRDYGGEYHGHAHVELTPSASMSLTTAKIQSIIGGNDMATLVKKGQTSEQVKFWQFLFRKLGYTVTTDGIYGPQMESIVNQDRAKKGQGPNPEISAWHAVELLEDLAALHAGKDGRNGADGLPGKDGKDGTLTGALTITGGTLTATAQQ